MLATALAAAVMAVGASHAYATDDPAQAAIQQTIQSVDDAQTQAVSSKDLSGLSVAATSDFAAQEQSDTQALLDNGVTRIEIVNIEWGPISVNGTTATATNFETWRTTYSDGSSDQSRDRNVYNLVQDNGTWKVQSDEHPDALSGELTNLAGIPKNLLPALVKLLNPQGNIP